MKIGDVVRLKSGGPPTTVIWAGTGSRYVDLVWFHEGEYKQAEIHEDALQDGVFVD